MAHTRRTILAHLFMAAIAGALITPVYSIQPPSPELVNSLTKNLSVTPKQAVGGAGALFSVAKSRLSPADFGKISTAVPGMSSFLKAAPSTSGGMGIPGVGSLPGNLGGMASAATAFQKLGLSPDMVGKFVPVLTSFLQAKGGSGVAGLLSGALK
jgi:hypothetical protein